MSDKNQPVGRAVIQILSRVREVTTNEEEFRDAIAVIGFEQGIKCRVANMELEDQNKRVTRQRDDALKAAANAEVWLRMMFRESADTMTKSEATDLLTTIRQCEDLRAWEFEPGKMPRFIP